MFFINIDGPDGAGKSTQVQNLIDYYTGRGFKVKYVHFPRYETPIGKLIQQVLSGKVKMDFVSHQLLYSADRIDFTVNELRKYKCDILIVDRYTTSGMAYGYAKGLDPEYIPKVECDVKIPNATILILPTVETCIERIKSDKKPYDIYENISTLVHTIDLYKKLGQFYPNVYILDGNKDKLSVWNDLITLVERLRIEPLV